MSRAEDRGRLDWLVELVGALAPSVAVAFAAFSLAPGYNAPLEAALLAGFGATFALAFTAMRLIPAEARHLALPAFEQAELPDAAMLADEIFEQEELLLTVRYVEWPELVLDQPLPEAVELAAVAELLLDDPLPAPEPGSRVVQLFADGRMPTAGQLQRRIERHLAGGNEAPVAGTNAADALSAALAELRRSLRQA